MSDWLGDVVFHGKVGQQEDGFFTQVAVASLYPPENARGLSFAESVERLREFELTLQESISSRCFRDLAALTSKAIREDVQVAGEFRPGLRGEKYLQVAGSFSDEANLSAIEELVLLGARLTGYLPARVAPHEGQPIIHSPDGNVEWGEVFDVFDYLHLRCRTEELSNLVGDSVLAGLSALGYPCVDLGDQFLGAMRCDIGGSYFDLFPIAETDD